jgi:hypothetical protein
VTKCAGRFRIRPAHGKNAGQTMERMDLTRVLGMAGFMLSMAVLFAIILT